MARKNTDKTESELEDKKTMLFEEMDDGFEIPARSRISLFDPVIDKLVDLDDTEKVVTIFRDPSAKVVYTKRQGLVTAAKRRKVNILSAVRRIQGEDGTVDHALLVQLTA